MRYKVGDKVRVRKDLEVGKYYGKRYMFNHEMEAYKGKELTITNICKYSCGDYYYKVNNNNRSWVDKMLESVEDIITYKGKKYDVMDFGKGAIELVNGNKFSGYDCLVLNEHKEEILDEAEKEYLRNVIKYVIEPTHNQVRNISKRECYDGDLTITIRIENSFRITLPYFKDKRMYKGMELDKEYTLEQLGL